MTWTYDVEQRPRLEVRVPAGRITVETGNEGSISVSVTGGGAESVEVGQTGDTVFVRRLQGGWFRSGSVAVSAVVPTGCEIEVSVASADIDLRGAMGATTVKSASGDLRAETVASLDVSSASGNLQVDDVEGDAGISTASGDVTLGSVNGRLNVKLASGDLEVGRVCGAAKCSSASGDLRVRRFEGDEITIKSVSGDTTVAFPAGTRLVADCTSLSGAIRFPKGDGPQFEGERREVRMSGRSVSGGISVERC